MASVNTGKQRALYVAKKSEIIQACENGNVSKSKIERHCNSSLSKLFMILKNNDKIKSTVSKSTYRYIIPTAAMFVHWYPDEMSVYINSLFMFAMHDRGIIIIIIKIHSIHQFLIYHNSLANFIHTH
jgi:hypothetical protein